MANHATLAAANFKRRTDLAAEVRGIAAKAAAEHRDLTDDEKAKVDEIKQDIASTDRRLTKALDELAAGNVGEDRGMSLDQLDGLLGDCAARSAGETRARAMGNLRAFDFDDTALRNLHEDVRSRRGGQIEARDVTAVPMSTFGEQFLPPAPFRREPTRVAALMPAQSVESASVTAYQGSTAASAADTVAEGAAKPESSPAWTAIEVPIRKIAHFADVSTESLADFADFAQIVQAEMIAGVINAENTQVLSGSGTAPDIKGLIEVSGIQTYAPSSAEKRLLSVLAAITMLRTGSAFTEADGVVLHPTDWQIIQSTAATDGSFIANATPLASSPLTVWGVPVVLSTGVSSGTAVVASFADAAIVFQREAPTITVDPFSQSANNLVRVIAEERLGLGVIRPTAVCKVTFNGTT